MIGIVLLCFCSVLLGAAPVLGGTEYRLGGTDGNPWQAILAGESTYQIFAADGQAERQVSVGVSPFGAGADTLIDFSGTSIQPRLIDPERQYRPGRCQCREDHHSPALYPRL